MERVTFLMEDSGLRLSCLLNPESLEIRRKAGVITRRSIGGLVSGADLRDDPLLHTGGGRTEMDLDLLFDTEIAQGTGQGGRHFTDVRDMTRPFWDLAENRDLSESESCLPLVRFIWGMAWNILGVVTAVAERLERFTSGGVPRRSWFRLRLRRVGETVEPLTPGFTPDTRLDMIADIGNREDVLDEPSVRFYRVRGQSQPEGDGASQERLDLICYREYGDASLWPVVAAFNELSNPLVLPLDRPLRLPTRRFLERLARGG